MTAVLSRRGDLTLHSLGGRIRPRTLASVGEWTITALGGIHADVAFLGSNGLSVRCGLTTPDQDEAATKRAMVACAARVVALVDSSKIGTDHFAKFGSLDQVDTVVTDTGLDPETADEIRAAGPEVLLA